MEVNFQNVSHVYMKKTPFETLALKNIDASFRSSSVTAVIGRTGSGKSTLVQHINGLLKPSSGVVTVGEHQLEARTKRKMVKTVRSHVGMVFQYPEHQLFEETVEKDLLFGPKNKGMDVAEIQKKLPELLQQVGLTETLLKRSPFELSGGQMRRVAIAGVLATNPDILILDEPTAGLDPQGQKEILELFMNWQRTYQPTTIMITHQMEEAAAFAEYMYVMEDAEIKMQGEPEAIYAQREKLREMDLDIPEQVQVLQQIERDSGIRFPHYKLSPEEAADYWEQAVQNGEVPYV
ncbi:energy-coupling factor transporter ATPase [Marinococcus halotolerans]|uniref:energy-coupling factor transporter ATPase n=1 Tax=Marinococcus halotolerans TaxID=301092 RepID=UPI0003B507FB|nr:energy-coupling factor transporter ATPase [Marinococcus halotolerans]